MYKDEQSVDISRSVKEAYVEHMLNELISQQTDLLLELNEFKKYSNKRIDSLENRLLQINNTIQYAKNGLQDLIMNDIPISEIKN